MVTTELRFIIHLLLTAVKANIIASCLTLQLQYSSNYQAAFARLILRSIEYTQSIGMGYISRMINSSRIKYLLTQKRKNTVSHYLNEI